MKLVREGDSRIDHRFLVLSNYIDGDAIQSAGIYWEESKIFMEGRQGNTVFCFSHIEFETPFRHLNRARSLRKWERL